MKDAILIKSTDFAVSILVSGMYLSPSHQPIVDSIIVVLFFNCTAVAVAVLKCVLIKPIKNNSINFNIGQVKFQLANNDNHYVLSQAIKKQPSQQQPGELAYGIARSNLGSQQWNAKN